ncbi:MAG: hypothetical protein R3E66_09355 [bacterium]
MRNGLLLGCVLVSLAACGVNPDRLATMQKRQADMAEKQNDGGDIKVEYSDSDPKAIRDAVTGLSELESSLAAGDFDLYTTKRYEITNLMSPELSPNLQGHAKREPILARVAQLDAKLAGLGKERGKMLVGSNRVSTASADALYAIQDAIDACARGVVANDEQMRADLFRKFEAGLERAKSLDGSSLSYYGRRPSGAGMIDVPLEVAVCEAKTTMREIEAADEAPSAPDLAKEYKGCGSFDVTIEAAQTGANAFGEFQIVGSSEQPRAVKAICEKMPPSSDAPSNVQRAIRDKALWLIQGDIISMAGPFEYDQRETLYKRGVARVFRKDATLRTNKCGTEDGTACEAEGSELARAINQGAHYMQRADFHRGNGNAARCKEMADRAYKALSASMTTTNSERILLSTGEAVAKAEAQSRLEALKSQANDALASDWCSKP